jgi:3-hydroxyacyl-CoA dehydrogenase
MKLVKIVVGSETSPKTVALLQLLTKQIGKIGVIVGNCYRFCGNHMLQPYSTEMVLLLVEGGGTTTTQQVYAAMQNFGMVLGPFEMSNFLAMMLVLTFIGNWDGFATRKL